MSVVKSIFKWLGIIVGAVIVLILLVVGYIYWKSGSKVGKKYEYSVARAVYAPADSAALARGKHLATALGVCVECHGENFGGKMVIDAPIFAIVYGPNLTAGQGGRSVGHGYDIKTFDRALRHGITKDGRGMYIMPSQHYAYLSDDDLGMLFSYITSLPPVDNEPPPVKFGPIGRMLIATGKLPGPWPELINHDAPRPAKPAQGATTEYGQYLTRLTCIGCHRPDMSGGIIEDGDPAWPPASNLTKGGVLKDYDLAAFKKVLTEGERPGGNPVAEPMANAVRYTGLMDDYEIEAIWLYLQSLPAVPTGTASWFTTRVP